MRRPVAALQKARPSPRSIKFLERFPDAFGSMWVKHHFRQNSILYYLGMLVFSFVLPIGISANNELHTYQEQIGTIDAEVLGAEQLKSLVEKLDSEAQVNAEALAAIKKIGDESTLILDPRTDTYYWVDTVVNFFPYFIQTPFENRAQNLSRQQHALAAVTPQCLPKCGENELRRLAIVKEINFLADLQLDRFHQEKHLWMSAIQELRLLLLEYRAKVAAKFQNQMWFLSIAVLLALTFAFGVVFQIHRLFKKQTSLLQQVESEKEKSIHSGRLALLGQASAELAHELKNPLSLIAGNAALILRHLNEPARIEMKVQAISKASERIVRIIENFRKLSRREAGSDHTECELEKVINEAIYFSNSRLMKAKVKIEVNLHCKPIFVCNEIEIEQVLINLISNSCDAIAGLSDRWIRIEVLDHKDGFLVQVIDSGSGLSLETVNSLFESFHTTKSSEHGTGLGLSLSKSIIERHNGKISVNQTLPNTCFELWFPRAETARASQKVAASSDLKKQTA